METEEKNEQQEIQTEEKKPDSDSSNGKKPDSQEKKYTDADVDNILNKKFAEWAKKRDAEVGEAKKLAEMNETEKSQYERDKLQRQLDELMAEKELNAMTKTARCMLSEAGITVGDDLISVMVTTDAEKTKAAVDSFITLFNNAVEDTVKLRLKGKAPKGGNSVKSMTKDEIMAVRDDTERQRLIMENYNLFNQ